MKMGNVLIYARKYDGCMLTYLAPRTSDAVAMFELIENNDTIPSSFLRSNQTEH